MNWKSHAIIGAIFAFAIAYLLGTRDIVSLAVLASFGAISALVPDLDHDTSKGKAILDIVFISFAFYTIYFGGCGNRFCVPEAGSISTMAMIFFAFLGAYFLIFRFFKPRHRGITHTLTACAGFGILVYLIAGSQLAMAGTLGYLSHLIADGMIRII